MDNGNDEKKKAAPRGDELDSFWDIGSLLPGRTRQGRAPSGSRFATNARNVSPSAVDIDLEPVPDRRTDSVSDSSFSVSGGTERSGSAALTRTDTRAADRAPLPAGAGFPDGPGIGVTHFVPPHSADELTSPQPPVDEYSPDGVLLHTVRVFDWQSNYHYFDQFTQDAVRMAHMGPSDSEPVRPEPFFSYFPQYAQLNRRQTAWYLWWRAQTEKHRYPDTDYAYILLYIFEQINLPRAAGGDDAADEAATARDRMADVWIAYRKRYPQLDHYMCEWMCDFCLIHRLTAPVDRLAPALDDIINMSRLKEFYLTAALTVSSEDSSGSSAAGGTVSGSALDTARILLRHCCQYDYKKSKFAAGEHEALFDATIPAAVAAVLPLLLGRNGQKPLITMQDTVMTRDAYVGALCSYRNKRRIEVSYTSFSRSHDLRFLIGDMVKHTENRLRGWIGVRSRLSVMSLPIPVRDALDAWLNPRAPAHTVPPSQKKPEARPDYERLYDLPASPVSLAHADEIEQTSWETTKRLTEAFGGADDAADDTPIPPPAKAPAPTPADPPQTASAPAQAPVSATPGGETLAETLGELAAFVRLAYARDYDGERAYARERHRMTDAVADEINGITAASELGDIILEGRGDGTYDVIDEYRPDITAALF